MEHRVLYEAVVLSNKASKDICTLATIGIVNIVVIAGYIGFKAGKTIYKMLNKHHDEKQNQKVEG